MTTDDLIIALNNCIAILQENKQLITPDLLTGVEKIVSDLSNITPPIIALADVSKVIDIEKRLVETSTTDVMIEIMTKIQNHPILLAMIAHML